MFNLRTKERNPSSSPSLLSMWILHHEELDKSELTYTRTIGTCLYGTQFESTGSMHD